MSVDKIEQTREIGDYEVTVAVNSPLRVGALDVLDNRISDVLDGITTLLERKREVVNLELTDIEAQELTWFLTPSAEELLNYADNMMSTGKGDITEREAKEYVTYLGKTFKDIRERLESLEKK